MLTHPKVIFVAKNCFESSLCQLFPKHNTFFCLDTNDCEILKYKKDSKFNILNWIDNIDYPNDNANEFLSYEIFNELPVDFIDRYNYDLSKGFLYASFIDFDKNSENFIFEDALLKILTVINSPVLITYSSEVKLSDAICKKINKWSKQNYLIINTNNKQALNVITNYDSKKTSINSVGDNASERQRISRKSARWQSGFSKLPIQEQDLIMMNLIESYLKGR